MSGSSGRVALVTGAGSGIGRACALALADADTVVAVLDVDADAAEESVAMVEARGAVGLALVADVRHEAQVEAAVKSVLLGYRRLDIAINSAGVNAHSRAAMVSTAEIEPAEWRRVLDTNAKGTWLCMKHELRAMKRAGRGAIVNVASIVGHIGFANDAAYVASKHAVIALTTAAAGECRAQRIRVNSVSPALVRSPSVERLVPSPALLADAAGPETVAAAALFLVSDAAEFVTGQDLVVGL